MTLPLLCGWGVEVSEASWVISSVSVQSLLEQRSALWVFSVVRLVSSIVVSAGWFRVLLLSLEPF